MEPCSEQCRHRGVDRKDVKEYKNYLKEKAVFDLSSMSDAELLDLLFLYVLSEKEFLRSHERIREFSEHNGNLFDAETLSLLLEMICKESDDTDKTEVKKRPLKKSAASVKKKAAFLKTVDALFKIYDEENAGKKHYGVISGYSKAGEFFRKYLGREKSERFCIAFLSRQDVILDLKKISAKDMTCTKFDSEDIAKHAFDVGAEKIIIAHNHTSGSLNYSKKDWFSSFGMAAEFKIYNLKLVEHYVVTCDGYRGILKNGISSYSES